MNRVFEDFVRIALREALGTTITRFPDRAPGVAMDLAEIVPLKPDLCLIDSNRILWVGDAKYKRLSAGAYQNADLYQLLAYAVALDLPGGMLIYGAHEGVSSADHYIKHVIKRLSVIALDLSTSPKKILQQIDGIANDIRAQANPVAA
jgi:5-methylcytosine-specific restriction enzyme subunit McrC